MNCKICNKPSGFFPLCKDCNKLKEERKIIQCENCKQWHYTNKPCNCESDKINKEEKAIKNVDINYTAFNIITKKREDFCQTFSVGMQIEHTLYYGNCTITDIDNESERIYFASQKNKSNDNSWAFSTVGIYLSDGTIIIHDETKKQKTEQKPNHKIELSNKVVIGRDVIDSETKDIRKKWEAGNLCDDGHYVRSYSEMLIDNWLYHNEYLHAYEKKVFMATEPDEVVLCDFYLPKGNVYIEFWGKDTEKYNIRRERKLQLYKDNNYNVISIEPDEIKIISDILKRRIFDYIKD